MQITRTGFKVKVNDASSWKVYITRTEETAMLIHRLMMTANNGGKDGYWHVSSGEVRRDCRIPELFHDCGFWFTAVEHNNGDWDAEQTYELYTVG